MRIVGFGFSLLIIAGGFVARGVVALRRRRGFLIRTLLPRAGAPLAVLALTAPFVLRLLLRGALLVFVLLLAARFGVAAGLFLWCAVRWVALLRLLIARGGFLLLGRSPLLTVSLVLLAALRFLLLAP